jgi:hypothetical protein
MYRIEALTDCLEDEVENPMVRHECAEALGIIILHSNTGVYMLENTPLPPLGGDISRCHLGGKI